MIGNNKKQTKINILKTRAQFDHVINQRAQVSSSYFVLHYCFNTLSTGVIPQSTTPVDNCSYGVSRLGLIIPKRWAKNAVTRSLIKRQCRAQFAFFANELPAGDWILRLQSTFDRDVWSSCSSLALKKRVRQELQHLFYKSLKTCPVSMASTLRG